MTTPPPSPVREPSRPAMIELRNIQRENSGVFMHGQSTTLLSPSPLVFRPPVTVCFYCPYTMLSVTVSFQRSDAVTVSFHWRFLLFKGCPDLRLRAGLSEQF